MSADRTVMLAPAGEGLVASWPQFTLRFLLDDGSTLDVLTAHDTSDLRAAVLKHTGAGSIAGTVRLPDAQQFDFGGTP